MKNKLLVTLFAVVAVSLAFTSCKPKSDVKDVCSDMLKSSMHKSARSVLVLNGETLTIKEYDFASQSTNDNRIVYREISFGNGTAQTKRVENLTYQYGEWNDHYTAYSMTFSPAVPYASAWYKGNSFITPDGLAFGGDGNDNTARVEKWEKTLGTFVNTNWVGKFEGEFVLDSIFRDSIRAVPKPKPHYDTIKIWTGEMDTLNADTTCTYYYTFNRDAAYANTGSLLRRAVRSKYDRETKTADTLSVVEETYDFNWFFSEVASDAKFKLTLKNRTAEEVLDVLDISKYKYDVTYVQDTTTMVTDTVVTHEFLLRGLMYHRP